MTWIVYRGFDDSMGQQRAIKSSEVLLTSLEPRWQVVQDPKDGTEYRALVVTVGVQDRQKTETVVCEASAVAEVPALPDVKHLLGRNRRERPILHYKGGHEPPQELAHLPELRADVVARMPKQLAE